MSFILSALKKSKVSEPGSRVLRAEAFDQAIAAHDDYNESRFSVYKKPVMLSMLAVFTAMALGYYSGGGLNVLNNQSNADNLEIQTNLTALASLTSQWPEESLKRHYEDDTINAVEYFENPNDYNSKLIALKQQQFEQQQDVIVAQQKAQAAKEQALLDEKFNQQLQVAIKQQGLVTQNQIQQQLVPPEADDNNQLSLNKEELSDVSPELLEAFENAVNDTRNDENNNNVAIESAQDEYRSKVKPLTQMPTWLQDDMPELHFTLHMYTSDPQSSWIRLNGRDYYAGEMSEDGLIIEQILPQLVILEYQGQRFSLPALSSW